MDVARQSTGFAEKYRPDLVEELRGTAEAAGVTLDDLMLLQVRNQFTPEKEGDLQRQSTSSGILSGHGLKEAPDQRTFGGPANPSPLDR